MLIFPEDYPVKEANINEHVFLLRVKKEVNPYFIFSSLKSKAGQIQINIEILHGNHYRNYTRNNRED